MVHGTSKIFYNNGQVMSLITYKNDERAGVHEEYDMNGNLTLMEYYLDDNIVEK